jgi:hypothetical protein
VSFALWISLMTVFWSLARRMAGARAAAIATAGVAALAAWAVPLLWIASVQELWMLLFGLLTLLAWSAGKPWLATFALALALLSKETAAVLAPLAIAYTVIVERRPPAAAFRRALPLIAVTALWALVHPVLGGRLWHAHSVLEAGGPPLGDRSVWRAIAVPVNLDALPRPERGWMPALLPGAIGALLLGAVAAAGLAADGRSRPREPDATPRLVAFGGVWAVLGWAPLLMPPLGWHAYYALLGSMGVWLALSVLLASRPWAAIALVMALALIRPARADTRSLDWGSEWYQRRAAEFIRAMRVQLLARHPSLPPHARLFFVRVPSNVGFLAGDAPALRVWYGDPTLRGGYYSSFRPRGPGEPPGPDYFFRFDSTTGWVEVHAGAEDVPRAREDNPRWETDHLTLAGALARGGDWALAGAEYAKLAGAFPERGEYPFNAGVSYETLGDSAAAALWYARAAALPGADRETQDLARRFARHLNVAPPSR